MPETIAVTGPLQELAATLRALGVRVGVGELLAAHRALAAVDSASREQAFHALRATLCSSHADQAPFALAFEAVFGPLARDAEEDPLAELGALARAALPRVGVPVDEQLAPSEVDAVPAAWSDD